MLNVRIVPERTVLRPAGALALEGAGAQVVALLVAAVGVPVATALALHAPDAAGRDGTWISAGAAAAAALAALAGLRRMTAFPGTRTAAYVLPSFCAAFGLGAALLLLLRLDYSGALLLTSFVASTLCGFMLAGRRGRAPSHFYLVPFGANPVVDPASRHRWATLREPAVPADPRATIIADLRADHPPEWERMLAQAALAGCPVLHAKQLRESLTGKVEIEHLSENGFGSLIPDGAYRRAKRLVDVAAVLLALPLLAVPLLVVAAMVRVDSPGPALFRQERTGYRGRRFRVVKFRTMHVARHADAPADPATDPTLGAMTRPRDARVTRIGRVLRRSRLDELPQLWNVLKGEMSLIGPRPEAAALSRWYEERLPFYAYRHIVRPGITGWAQVNQGHVVDLGDVRVKLHYDFFYIKNFSAWLDALIALRTVATMLTGFGAR